METPGTNPNDCKRSKIKDIETISDLAQIKLNPQKGWTSTCTHSR